MIILIMSQIICNLDDCNHQYMLFDSNIIDYLKNVSSNETNITTDRINAAQNALKVTNMTQYEQRCNLDLVLLADITEYANIVNSDGDSFSSPYDENDTDADVDTDIFYPQKTGANMYKLNIILTLIGLLSYISI